MTIPTARTHRSIFTIPSSDRAFAEYAARANERYPRATPSEFERRLRKLFPRVVVRERSLSGEAAAWYVYRDGSWRPSGSGPWWEEPGLPRMVVSLDGWMTELSRTAAELLGIDENDATPKHFTDFVVPGTLEESMELFQAVLSGHELEATVLMRPTSGDVIAIDLHVVRRGDHLESVYRLADEVSVEATGHDVGVQPKLTFIPPTDVAFRAYAERALERMPEPTADGLAIRLRRLYPHAQVAADGDTWTVHRDRVDSAGEVSQWWLDKDVARVRYDAQGLILDANDAAATLFDRQLVGHYWQEFVTPGSSEQVTVMLEILAEVGAAESRFRIPRPDGSLLEFDSYTEVVGDEYTTAFRPVQRPL